MKLSNFFLRTGAAILACTALFMPLRIAAQSPRTISVVGTATEGGTKASVEGHGLTLRVTAKDVTATLAFAKLSDQIRSLKKILIDAGAESDQISEGEMQMSPSYDYSKAGLPPTITGYQITKPVLVKVERESDLPKLIDAATQAGVSSVALGASDEKSTSESDNGGLEQAALKDAHQRAEQLAKQIGATLGDVVSVSTVESGVGAAKGGGEREEEERRQFSAPKTKSVELKVVYAIH